MKLSTIALLLLLLIGNSYAQEFQNPGAFLNKNKNSLASIIKYQSNDSVNFKNRLYYFDKNNGWAIATEHAQIKDLRYFNNFTILNNKYSSNFILPFGIFKIHTRKDLATILGKPVTSLVIKSNITLYDLFEYTSDNVKYNIWVAYNSFTMTDLSCGWQQIVISTSTNKSGWVTAEENWLQAMSNYSLPKMKSTSIAKTTNKDTLITTNVVNENMIPVKVPLNNLEENNTEGRFANTKLVKNDDVVVPGEEKYMQKPVETATRSTNNVTNNDIVKNNVVENNIKENTTKATNAINEKSNKAIQSSNNTAIAASNKVVKEIPKTTDPKKLEQKTATTAQKETANVSTTSKTVSTTTANINTATTANTKAPETTTVSASSSSVSTATINIPDYLNQHVSSANGKAWFEKLNTMSGINVVNKNIVYTYKTNGVITEMSPQSNIQKISLLKPVTDNEQTEFIFNKVIKGFSVSDAVNAISNKKPIAGLEATTHEPFESTNFQKYTVKDSKSSYTLEIYIEGNQISKIVYAVLP